jgi:hypothetical protein
MLTLDEAQKLFAKSANCTTDDAVRAIYDIASQARHQQAGWGRLRLEAIRALGRYLIRNGRPQGRPAKTSDPDNLQTLVGLGIADRHISADAKKVARIPQRVFDAYLRDESEPTLAGLLRFAEFAMPDHSSGRNVTVAQNVDFANSSIEYFSPPEIFIAMGDPVFDTDVASPGGHLTPWIKARRFITRAEDALAIDWRDFGFCWMNSPHGLRNLIDEWAERFIAHRNGIALVNDFTSAGWWQDFAGSCDAILFVSPKIQFITERHIGINSLGTTLVACGPRGVDALVRAERNGRGTLFDRSAARGLINIVPLRQNQR